MSCLPILSTLDFQHHIWTIKALKQATMLLQLLTLLVAMSLTDRCVWIVSSCSRHQSNSPSVVAASLSKSSSDLHSTHVHRHLSSVEYLVS